MNFYDFEEIKSVGDCVALAENLGASVDRTGRCAAVWRGGDGPNVAVSRDEWYDHKAKVGGGIIDLCAVAKFGGDIQQAQNYLGEWLKLTPKMQTKKLAWASQRYDELIGKGYQEAKRYSYTDLDGNLVHFVARLEHPTLEKEFLQGTPNGWGLRDTTPILYRLADWVHAPFVCVVEGEKDADTVIDRIGFPATTNCGGSEKWRPEYAEHFRGKNVVILRDNDEAGEKHARRVACELKDVAKQLFVICPSALPKGDVTDWVDKEGGTKEQLFQLMKAATPIDLSTLEDIDPLVDAAKSANRIEFSNYTEFKQQEGNKVKVMRSPRQINDIIEDVHRRFMGFPRKVGNSKFMFDHDRESHEIVYLHDASELIAWVGRKSKRRVAWGEGDSMVTKGEIFKGLLAEARRYESISYVPDWPSRPDVYYAHSPLPKPSPGFQFFNQFVDFFAPASEAYRTFLKAFICAPIWYLERIPRPGWIIDSQDGAGAGKTTMVELVSMLYGADPIRTNKQELRTDIGKLIKRIVSTEGRIARILLADNVTGDFHSAELSDMMTAGAISGIAPYGRGEESRPNNLTYVITANSATVDNDLSDRCFFIQVCRPKRSGNWKRKVLNFIEDHRLQILADIFGMLEVDRREDYETDPQTRFPEFEETILRAVCKDPQDYYEALACLAESKAASNSEDEHAKTIEDEFSSRLIEAGRQPGREYIFIRNDVAKHWLIDIFGSEPGGNAMQYLRNLAKNRLTGHFDIKPERYPHNGPNRRRGIMWRPQQHDGGSPRVIGLKNKKVVEII
jgi:hypothetical protein